MTSFRNCKAAWKRRLVPGVFLYIETEDEEIDNIMKRVKFLEESGLLIKAVSEIKNEIKEQEDGFFSMLLNSLGTRLLVNLLTLIYYSLN